jgi:PAT family beta-lactamase induction signal transducer AmpG
VAGYLLTQHLWSPLASALLLPWLQATALATPLQQRWTDLAALLLGLATTLPLAAWAARRARFTPCCRAWPATSASPAPGPSWA